MSYNDVMFSAPRDPPRNATAFQSWGDRDETTEHFFPQKKSGGVKANSEVEGNSSFRIGRGHFFLR